MSSLPLDLRFLKPHPATQLWHQQREQCLRCGHVRMKPDNPAMRCTASDGNYCVDARLAGQPCGPDARLFELKGNL